VEKIANNIKSNDKIVRFQQFWIWQDQPRCGYCQAVCSRWQDLREKTHTCWTSSTVVVVSSSSVSTWSMDGGVQNVICWCWLRVWLLSDTSVYDHSRWRGLDSRVWTWLCRWLIGSQWSWIRLGVMWSKQPRRWREPNCRSFLCCHHSSAVFMNTPLDNIWHTAGQTVSERLSVGECAAIVELWA